MAPDMRKKGSGGPFLGCPHQPQCILYTQVDRLAKKRDEGEEADCEGHTIKECRKAMAMAIP